MCFKMIFYSEIFKIYTNLKIKTHEYQFYTET